MVVSATGRRRSPAQAWSKAFSSMFATVADRIAMVAL